MDAPNNMLEKLKQVCLQEILEAHMDIQEEVEDGVFETVVKGLYDLASQLVRGRPEEAQSIRMVVPLTFSNDHNITPSHPMEAQLYGLRSWEDAVPLGRLGCDALEMSRYLI